MTPVSQKETSFGQDILTMPEGDRIVISGMSGLYPQSHSVKEFSEILYNKINPVNVEQLRYKYIHPEVMQHGGSVPELDRFDAQFFKVHYRLGSSMDSMARKILEQSYQAIYDAGVNPEHLSGKKVGVYIGTCFSETEKAVFYEAAGRSGFGIAGCSKTMFSNRVSYWLNAKGPSMSIDEACCSSTAALEQAYQAISRGECEAAIVGGAYLCLHPQSSVHYSRIMKLCTDGKTKSFDENADGCAKSEAINVLFLQKAKDAIRIYADVVHAKTEFTCILEGETGPRYGFDRDVNKTISFVKDFYNEAKVPTQAIEYVEALGCAVPEADKVELQTIENVFCNQRDTPLLVGSVMSNIGYSEAASGISAITKVLLGYHTGQIAANLHLSKPRQDVVALKDGRMRVVTDHQTFDRTYTAVNGMSVTGVNSHVLLNGHYKAKDLSRYKCSIPYLVTITARHEEAVQYVIDDLKSQPIDPEQLRLLNNIHQASIAGHLGRGYVILKTDEKRKTVSLCEKAEYFDDAPRPLWFVYSGMGSQWAGMGTQLMRIPIFAAAIEKCRRVLEPKGIDIVDIITSTDEKTFDNILHSFVGIAAIQIGLTDILHELGLIPDGIIGHSVGELGCAYADGCLTAEEMILSAYSRGLVSLETPFIRGSMAAIGLGYEQIVGMCPPEIEVACHNGPESSTISGPADIMREFVAQLTAKGIFAKEVPCSNIAYHSRYIADAGPQLLKYLSEVIKSPKPRSDRWLSSSVPQEKWDSPDAKLCSAGYHTNNLLSPVLFEETLKLVPNNAVLVEVAPHGLLQAILKRSLPATCKNIALTRRKHPDNAFLLLESIGKLFMEGYYTKLHVLYPKVELPVSTGTPFLSHLVKWAHGEKWFLPLYHSATRLPTASCEHIISIHDLENSYLQGHSLRGRTLYPFAALLVLVWDTLSMVLGVPKKHMSVQFNDLHLYTQPILHDRRQLKLNVAMQRGTGSFEILSENIKVASGYINTATTKKVITTLTRKEVNNKISMDFTAEDIYNLLQDRDYSYNGEFRSLVGADESFSTALLEWRNNWVTFIDGLIQLHMLRQPHTAVSLPTNIRSLTINVPLHENSISQSPDNKVILKAELLDKSTITRCGGVTIDNVKLENLPPQDVGSMVLKALKFVPNLQSIKDVTTSLEVFLQIVAENVNKENINIVGIVHQPASSSIFNKVNSVMTDVFGVNVKYEQIDREAAMATKQNNFLAGADAVLVQNLSTDDNLRQLLYRVLNRNQFIISEDDRSSSATSPLYRSLYVYTIVNDDNRQQSQLQLARWGATPAPAATTTVTVRSEADVAALISTRNYMFQGHRLLVLAPYPSPNGLKELVKSWRKEANRNKVHLIMVDENSNNYLAFNDLPDIDLAFTVLDNENWGGEYYVSVRDCTAVSKNGKNVSLKSSRIGELDSLTWVEAPEITGPGITVQVHYAGISHNDAKTASGSIIFKQNIENSYGMDFSGVTNSGQRVMGLIPCGAVSSVVRAHQELLWPVPAHWTLEEAATVPLAFVHAFYCLTIKIQLEPDWTVLVHGGTGAFAQAVIAIALNHGCTVFTTVSDMSKKRFLLKLFPELKADNIGPSRDHSFRDMILSATGGKGCYIVINTLQGNLKKTSLQCVGGHGTFIDISQLQNQDDFKFGMYNLANERNYVTSDLPSLFNPENIEDVKRIHTLISTGISRGYVRPLSHVTYEPQDVTRAFRLLAASRHRGKVLLRMHDRTVHPQPRLTYNVNRCHLIICNDETLGLQLASRLVERGARKLCIHFKKQSMSYLQCKIRSWRKSGVQVVEFSEDLHEEMDLTALFNNATKLGPLEGVYVTVSEKQQVSYERILTSLDTVSRKLSSDIKYFAVLNIGNNTIGKNVCIKRVKDQLPATFLSLPELNGESCAVGASSRSALDATERALRAGEPVLRASVLPEQQESLLEKIATLAKISLPQNLHKSTTLGKLGVTNVNIPSICYYLKHQYSIAFEEEQIPSLTVEAIDQLEKILTKKDFDEIQGLSTFFSYVDTDELLASTEIVTLPTLINSATMRDDEFDLSQTYLCIVPGMEGHYERFRVLCERLKLHALVLQPGYDRPNETVREMAERHTATLLEKAALQKTFYLLGYESGVSVALEIAAILEEHGLTGTVFCIGYSPGEFRDVLEEKLSGLETMEQLQDAVMRHMFTLMTGDNTIELDNALEGVSSWPQKIEVCVRTLLGRVPHSAQFAGMLIKIALARIVNARSYVAPVRKLRSQLVLLRPASPTAVEAPLSLQQHSQLPVAVHQLRAPLALATSDLRCGAIINSYLDEATLGAYNEKNTCDTYLLNGHTYMQVRE